MNRKVFREIARKNRTTTKEVKREMQEAINQAYINPNYYANCVPRQELVPTISEFMDYVKNRALVMGR